ncbi:MAG: pirin [Candidatus Thiodiazotropha weberae]|nr:pirin [Candidatus Thiodiazotropha lotti]MCG8020898.1 pirin [Candidatus Thiodiazotropha lotti]MCW4208064.1 replication protein RepA [Candidatus Thiodiazotropha lotti]MCW4216551.1 replication protein RepA [Candidatus Thiodiazotropha lotti]
MKSDMISKHIMPRDKFINEVLAIEALAAKEAGAIGYMARALVQATLPHRKRDGAEFTRRNGAFTLSLLAPSHVGLPYGSIPRLLVSWVTTEAVRTGERELILGDNLSQFMRELGMVPTGGRWGTVTRLKEQMRRLFASSIIYTDNSTHGFCVNTKPIADTARLWWDPKRPEQAALWESTLKLGEQFFDEITRSPVPIDLRALKALKRSPMALDIYCWLTYRLSYLRKPTVIPWVALQIQLGAEYGRARDFKAAFVSALRKVLCIYGANVEEHGNGLLIKPSRTHIPRCA